ncbi:maintenance of mitochondrial structure and function-domain-containing protein [Umbelopsis sp. PMI_123]|nr:maintenance of mitochondrial structure and function-domain-containing protein [Umbelopsis sp. PMI_123]
MPLSTKSSTLHLSSTSGAPAFRPFTCVINPVVLFSILDHYLRRNEGQERVIGTLLGVRSDDGTEVEIRNCFNVPHQENDSEVAVDMEHHRAMFELHQRVNPKEVIVGWYATGSQLNSYSALIQDFYSSEVAPFQAVHLTMDTDLAVKGTQSMGLQTHISAPVGVSAKSGNCMFLPVPCEVRYFDAERSGLEILATAKNSDERTASLLSDMDHLEIAITKVQEMLERVSQYVQQVLNGKEPANNAIGRYIMDSVSVVPKVDATSFEKMFNSHLQDLLMVVYLANMTRTQLSVAERLNTLV